MEVRGEAKASNVLRIGESTLRELDEKVKAFRTINLNVKKRRFIISREDIRGPDNSIIVKKGEDIDLAKVKLMARHFKAEQVFKTFQPDEGIVLITDMNTPAGIQMSMDMVTQIMNIGGGAYEAFIDRVDSFKELSTLLSKALFPKLVVIGFIPTEKMQEEVAFYHVVKRFDPYIRMMEVNHTQIKPNPVLPKLKQVVIAPEDRDSWKRFIVEIMQVYTQPYSIEDR